jgi:hypothetical protein
MNLVHAIVILSAAKDPSGRGERRLTRGFFAALRMTAARNGQYRVWRAGRLAFALGAAATALAAPDGLPSAALAPRSGPRGATLFKAIPPEQSGIAVVNDYADPKMWTDHYQELVFGAMGSGVAVGDYDNDGRPDLFVVGKTGDCRLFRNRGDWRFEDVTVSAGMTPAAGGAWARMKNLVGLGSGSEEGGAWCQGATFADVNNDGWLDLHVCRWRAPNLLYINQGNGTFKEEAAARGLALVDASGMAAFADYDCDGWLDVYVLTSLLDAVAHPNGQRDRLYRNQGNGHFVEVAAAAGIAGEAMGHSVTWWDPDHDGWPDLYVANDYGAPDHFYRNNRDGTFTDGRDAALPHTPYYAMGADAADVNNDGLMDLLVADMAASSPTKDLRGMASSRARTQTIPDDPAATPQVMRNALYLNTGTGVFQEAAHLAGLAATDWTWSVRWEDLDNDGRVDLHVTNGMIREFNNTDLMDRIMALENQGGVRQFMKGLPVMAETNFAFRNAGDLRFEETGRPWGLDQRGVSFGTAFADFDGDGDLDAVFANYEAGVTVLRNDSADGHRLLVALRGTRSNRFGFGAAVRIETASGSQMRYLAPARGYLSSSEPLVHFGLGADEAVRRLTVIWPGGGTQVLENLPVDRRITITEPATGAPPVDRPVAVAQFTDVSAAWGLALVVEETFETSGQQLLPMRFDRTGPTLAVGDISGDGRPDVVVGGTRASPATVGVRGERFLAAALPPTPLDDGPFLVFDADGDGRNDLLRTRAGDARSANAADYQPELYRRDAEGAFAPVPGALPAVSLSVGAACAADFDRDGRLDVFLGARLVPGRYPAAPRSLLWANRGGRFEDVTETIAPGLREVGLVTAALWSDVDADGWPDLLVALEWGGVKCFRNDTGRRLEDWSERAGFASAGTGWWTALASADFNGDGQPDYVAGNAGLNTPYQASSAQPALLYAGRFGGSGPVQLLEARHEGKVEHPWRSRNELGAAAIPNLMRRFPRNDAYAAASVAAIAGPDKLAAARAYAATELRSGVFLSQPDGRYRFAPLPRIAQIAPLQGIVAGDFDGDGCADIYAVQNSFAPAAVTGRFDGGVSQLLRGDGRGGFTPVSPQASGLVVRGDAKALATLDLDEDGWADFLLTRNGALTQAWRNGGVAGRHGFQVALRGPAGNAEAVGARVTVELDSGHSQTAEVQAGGGYRSQSSSGIFFGYPDRDPPRRCRVRWPDGVLTEHKISAAPGARLVLARE